MTVAMMLGVGAVLSVSAALPALVTVGLAAWALRAAWASAAGEEIERTTYRRWRWLRRARHRTAALPEPIKLWVW
jgi:hypothetical protein